MRLPFGNPFNPATRQEPSQGQQQNQQPGQQQNTMNVQNQNSPTNQSFTVPGQGQDSNNNNNSQNQNQNGQSADPMKDFSQLWHNPDSVDENGQPKITPKKSYVPQFKPEQLSEIVGKWDFVSKTLTPERRAAIVGGGENAVSAMSEMMNESLRQGLLTVFQANTRLTETALNNAESGFMEGIPNRVKDVMTENSLTSDNPMMSDPRFAPMVDSIRRQAQDRFPKATPQQLTKYVNEYFDSLHQEMTGQKNKNTQVTETNDQKLKTGSNDADWTAWAQDEINSIFGDPTGQQSGNPNARPNGIFETPNQQQQNQQPAQSGTYTF